MCRERSGSLDIPVVMALIALALAGLSIQAAYPASNPLASICGTLSLSQLADPNLLRSIIWSPSALALEWLLMVLAMMPPLVARQTSFLIRRSQSGNRFVSTFAFLVGYILVWFLAGLVLAPLGVVAAAVGGQLQIGTIISMSVIWTLTGGRVRFLDAQPPLAMVRHNVVDSIAYGTKTGLACTWACWPWMLLPGVMLGYHSLSMIVVSAFLFADRMGWLETVLLKGLSLRRA